MCIIAIECTLQYYEYIIRHTTENPEIFAKTFNDDKIRQCTKTRYKHTGTECKRLLNPAGRLLGTVDEWSQNTKRMKQTINGVVPVSEWENVPFTECSNVESRAWLRIL